VLQRFGEPATGAKLPAGLHAGMVQASEDCFGCNVCETVCATSALRILANDDFTGLLFTPARCTGCGACAEACLVSALTLSSATSENASVPLSDAYLNCEEVVLTEVAPRACIRCNDLFTGSPGELCDACLSSSHGADRLRGLSSAGES